jgi:hypothetical protein
VAAARFPQNQVGGERGEGREALSLPCLPNRQDRERPEPQGGLSDGGERHDAKTSAGRVVETRDGDSLRTALLGLAQGLDRTERRMVIYGQQGVESAAALPKLGDGAVSSRNREVAAHHVAGVE